MSREATIKVIIAGAEGISDKDLAALLREMADRLDAGVAASQVASPEERRPVLTILKN